MNEVICPRHGGIWGNDETCTACTDMYGNPRPIESEMKDFKFEVTISAKSAEEALQVIQERLSFEEDYGFPYSVEWESK